MVFHAYNVLLLFFYVTYRFMFYYLNFPQTTQNFVGALLYDVLFYLVFVQVIIIEKNVYLVSCYLNPVICYLSS